MYQHQDKLTRLPVPPLKQTLQQYLIYMKPLVSADEFEKTKSIVEEFGASDVSKKLQKTLENMAKDAGVENWLDRWWSDAYLKDRSTPGINVSPCACIRDHPMAEVNAHPAVRATLLIQHTVEFYNMIESATLEPDMFRDRAMCMRDYPMLFGAARVPHKGRDETVRYSKNETRHIVVFRKGRAFRVPLAKTDGTMLTTSELVTAMHRIYQLATKANDSGLSFAAFTALTRDEWATARDTIIESSSFNHKQIRDIETSLFVVTLDDACPTTATERVVFCQHGFTTNEATPHANRYFDKTLQVHVADNGAAAMTFEHSAMDSLPPLRWNRHVLEAQEKDGELAAQVLQAYKEVVQRDQENNSNTVVEEGVEDEHQLIKELCVDEIPDSAKELCKKGHVDFSKMMRSLDSAVTMFKDFGANTVKAAGSSPDAFAQMCFQVTFDKLFGYVPCTYESATTKVFLLGRTETLRPVSDASVTFAKMMNDPSAAEEKIAAAYLAATKAHRMAAGAAVTAQACDRHLYGLLCAARENNIPLPALFMDPSFAKFSVFEMSTSHPLLVDGLVSCAFGPVSPRCMGVAYFLFNEEFLLGITSWNTHHDTDGKNGKSKEFLDTLQDTMKRLRDILEKHKPAKM